MKKFIRDNPTIAFGLGLPLLLVAVFLAISGIPALLVAPPQYEVLYATHYNFYNNAHNAIQISRSSVIAYRSATSATRSPTRPRGCGASTRKPARSGRSRCPCRPASPPTAGARSRRRRPRA